MTNRLTPSNVRFAFFGTSHIAVYVLDELVARDYMPALIVTPEDKPQGRGLASQPCAVAEWALAHDAALAHDMGDVLMSREWDVCVVVDYGHLIPAQVLTKPKRGFLNVHPSLLPRLRGPSPIRTAILMDEKDTGVTIMLVDEELDHGPIVAQKRVMVRPWPPRAHDLERQLMQAGGELLAQILPEWIAGTIDAKEQNHDLATFTEKMEKQHGLLDLAGDPYQTFLKIRAYEGWPGTHAYFLRGDKRIRVAIVDAEYKNAQLVITRVKPEGKMEMPYADFLRSGARPA